MIEVRHPNMLEHVVEMTSQREQHALQLCMVKTLQEFVSACEISLYGLVPSREESALKLLVSAASADQQARPDGQRRFSALRNIEDDADLKQCFATGEQVVAKWESTTGDDVTVGVKMVYPIATARGLIGFLVVKGISLSQRDQDLALGFLRIYHNYLQLIDANERDALTGLLNRKTFIDRMMAVLATQRALPRNSGAEPAISQRCCIAMLDIDHFKRVNDTFGHLQGDEVLLRFARLMTQTFREVDQLYRYGGEEFIVLLKGVDLKTGLAVLERFRHNVETMTIPQVGHITVSIGAVEVVNQALPTTAVEQADKALYHAKEHGRNQVVAYENLVADGVLADAKTTGDIELF